MNTARLTRPLALAAALALAVSGTAIGASDSTGQTATLTVSPYIEVAGIAATLDFSAGGTYGTGDELRANSFTGINSGAGSSFTVGTNAPAGYTFGLAIADLTGAATSETVPATDWNVQLTNSNGDTVDLTGGMLTALATYADYAGPAAAEALLWTCDGTCTDADPAAETYLAKLQIDVPAGLSPDEFTGSVTYVAATS